MSKRCSCYAVSTDRICKKKYTFIIQGKRFCYIHARYEYNKYALFVQRCWKGYRHRCIMKNVYTKLPDELQRKILFYIRENYLIKKHHHNIIYKILDSKFDRVWLLSTVFAIKTENTYNISKIAHIYYLYSKYFTIAPQHKITLLKQCISDFIIPNTNNNPSLEILQDSKLRK